MQPTPESTVRTDITDIVREREREREGEREREREREQWPVTFVYVTYCKITINYKQTDTASPKEILMPLILTNNLALHVL